MDNVVLLFGMVANLVVDVRSRFNSIFKDMCAALGIIYWPLARGNHKVISVKIIISFSTKLRQ